MGASAAVPPRLHPRVSSSMPRSRSTTARLGLRLMRDLREGGPRPRSAGVARAPTWSSFPASGSCLASAFIRRRITACSALVLCPPMVPRGSGRHSPRRPRSALPPFPGVVPTLAAIPRTASMATIDAAYGVQLRPHTGPESGDGRDLNRRRRRSPRRCQRTRGQGLSAGCGGLGLLATGGAVYGPARIAAPAFSGPSPSRGEAALVWVDRAAA